MSDLLTQGQRKEQAIRMGQLNLCPLCFEYTDGLGAIVQRPKGLPRSMVTSAFALIASNKRTHSIVNNPQTTMKIKNQELWDKGLANNQDPYGNRCYTYARDWADLMESRIAKGENIAAMAKETSREADTDGITGFMYGVAVSILYAVWEHGEALRLWHNLDTQIGTEGEKANDNGTVLNPALLNVQPKPQI